MYSVMKLVMLVLYYTNLRVMVLLEPCQNFLAVRATLHWEQDYPRNREGYCFNPEGLFQPAEQRTEEQRKRVVFQLRGLTGIVSTWTHRERDNRQVERERGETQRVVDKE